MNSVAPSEPTVAADRSQANQGGEGIGFLVVEQRSSTPLGPRIVHVNEEMCRLSGYERSSLIGSPLGLLYDRGDLASLIGRLPIIAARSNHCFMDRVLLRHGGSRLPCHWTIRPTTREGEPSGYFALSVTPMLRKERFASVPQAPAARARAEAATTPPPLRPGPSSPAAPPTTSPVESVAGAGCSAAVARDYENSRIESISLTAGGVAHDFKNALQTIKSNLEIAFLELGPLPHPAAARSLASLSEAQLALDDAELLARQMLAFTRGETGRRRVFHPGELLRRVSRLCSAGSKIRCRLFLPDEIRCVEGDPAQIYQVLHNLVINARQAMPDGGTIDIAAGNAELRPENRFDMPPGRYTVASVRDRGYGIQPEHLPRIFEPDFSTKAEGNGLGLASCRAIVEEHGGGIRVASKVGVGTEFLVFLPSTEAIAENDPAWPEPPQALAASAASSPRSQVGGLPASASGRILVVDDEPGVARSTAGLLRHFGYEVLVAGDGEKAISLFREHLDSDEPIDAVLLDMTLPNGLSGEEVAREMARIEPAVRIVATSGNLDRHDAPPPGPFATALAKPYSQDSLRDAIARALAA